VNYVKAQPQPILAKNEGRILLADSSVVNPPADQGTGNGQTTPTPSQSLPNTASNMYNFLLLGMLIIGFGLTLVMRRRRVQA
jgi:2',3'-cyclic-nucleotide 2'-phosphodiesterase/3'-nucleotidase/5'-nucleotidase